MDYKYLVKSILKSDRNAIAKAITQIENETGAYREILDAVYPNLGKAYRIGITGPPGVGKSTMTNHLARLIRNQNLKVGIIAIDPTSPFTGGAVLGDRLRMGDLILDRGVYIRSMASRGSLGGLAATATQAADILDAAGYEIIIFETVGVGQVELDIADAADTTMVMLVPEGGDIIQGLKAGLMEIGDIFILNKYDRPGSERMQKDLEYVLHLKESVSGWDPKVLPSIAIRGEKIDTIWVEIGRHREFLQSTDLLQSRRLARLKTRLKTLIRAEIERRVWTPSREKILSDHLKKEQQNISPYLLANQMIEELMRKS